VWETVVCSVFLAHATPKLASGTIEEQQAGDEGSWIHRGGQDRASYVTCSSSCLAPGVVAGKGVAHRMHGGARKTANQQNWR
jgi:hypothetical protein